MEALIQALHRLGEALDEEGGPGESSPPEEGQALEARQRDLVARFVRLPEGAIRRRSRSVDRVLLHPLVGVFFQRPWWAPGLVLFGFYVLSFAAAIITGLVFKRVYPSQEAFVLELPPYRSPSLKTVVRRGWTSMLNFFVTTRVFIIFGATAIWLLTHLPPGAAEAGRQTLAGGIGTMLHPLLGPVGLNPDLSVSLFFGFIAKEILLGALAVIYRTSETHLAGSVRAAITPLQALSYMTFVLLYTPCLGRIAAQLKESKSRGFALTSLGWSLGLAWLMAFLVYQGGLLIQSLV